MDRMRSAADAVMASRPVAALGDRSTRRSLRVLAYHGVHDVASFEAQMRHLVDRYRPVSAAAVVAALRGDLALPDGATWVTFDDGDASIVEEALPVMERLGIRPTVFVCPGLVGTDEPFWWDVVAAAIGVVDVEVDGRRYGPGELLRLKRHLKAVPDDHRRAVVAELGATLARETGRRPTRRHLTVEQLERLVAAGGTVGNHTWDHPCLNRCVPSRQRRQILDAHAWLVGRLDPRPLVFAYPNGDHDPEAERVLRNLGYDVAVLFDHRMGSVREDRLRLSRLRVNDDTDLRRFGAILAGVHPAIHSLRRRLGR